MREPVIEDNAADHAQFCKYAADLLERVTGKSLATSSAVPSLSRITKVTYSQLPLYLFTPLWERWFVIHSGSPDQNEKKLKLWCALVYKYKPKSQRNKSYIFTHLRASMHWWRSWKTAFSFCLDSSNCPKQLWNCTCFKGPTEEWFQEISWSNNRLKFFSF